MNSQYIIEQHYADLHPLRFIELSEQIQQLYDGPWVQMGSFPEEGTNNPNPTDQSKARTMWRGAYKLLKPYEKLIYEDYQDISIDSLGAYADRERQAITAMWKLCEAYHNVVELWDQLQVYDGDPAEDEDDEWGEDIEEAYGYYEAIKDIYMRDTFPKQKDMIDKWYRSLKGLSMTTDVISKKEWLKTKVIESGFIMKYSPSEKFYETYDDVYNYRDMADEEYAQALYDMATYSRKIDDLMDDELGIAEGKIARYIFEHRADLSPIQINTFFNYMVLTKYIDGLRNVPYDTSNLDYFWDSKDRKSVNDQSLGNQHNVTPVIVCKFFKSELRESLPASEKFLEVMKAIDPLINTSKGSRRDKIKWPHIKEALNRCNLIDEAINPTDFGNAIYSILPSRSALSVKQSFKTGRINEDFPNATDENIINDIKKKLTPVLLLMK